jgi:hypothetical protein
MPRAADTQVKTYESSHDLSGTLVGYLLGLVIYTNTGRHQTQRRG